MPVLRFHAVGNWPRNQLHTRWEKSEQAPPAEVQTVIDREWEHALARPNVKLFDGPMCRLQSWRAAPDGGLELVLGPTSYKHFLGTNMRRPELADRFGPGVLANPVGVSAIVETADGFLLLGRRNASVAYYPGRIHPFAGSLEPVDAGGGSTGPDPFAAVMRELAEELAVTPADVTDLRCTGLVEDAALRQPELIFRAATPRTRATVEPQVARDEHHASVAALATEAGVTGLLQDPALTPVAVASLLLWGRLAFGPAWFVRHVGRWS
jgi:8-oxo-dGTP pyrophosphatase MutT (NUDIX family)